MNIKDFWNPTLRDKRYCIVCMDVPDERQNEIPGLLRWLFRLPMFKTKANRMGKVAKVNNAGVKYYQLGDEELHSFTVSHWWAVTNIHHLPILSLTQQIIANSRVRSEHFLYVLIR